MDPAPGSAAWAGISLPAGIETSYQGEGDLGERMARVARRSIARGEAVLLIGADCPDLTAERLRAAAARLANHDAVLHRAEDGGYPLLGLRAFHASLFEDMPWGTAKVADLTLARLMALGWRVWLGDTLRDIDEPGDLAGLEMYSGN
jgi:rSAM/selenodomain-associated transferase 1